MIQTFPSQTVSSSASKISKFSLLSQNSSDNKSYDVEVDFSSQIINDFLKGIPKYNFDKDPFSGGFKIAFEKKQNALGEITSVQTEQLHNRLKNLSQKRVEILEPKPNHNYCQVCKESFIDYAKHILHKIHIKNIKNSPFNHQIEDLIHTFHRKPTRLIVQSELDEHTQKRRIVQGAGKAPIALRLNKDTTESTNCSFGIFTTTKPTIY